MCARLTVRTVSRGHKRVAHVLNDATGMLGTKCSSLRTLRDIFFGGIFKVLMAPKIKGA